MKPGIILIQGANGQGKSNLLEAIYILSIAKSHRTRNEKDLIYKYKESNIEFTQIESKISYNQKESKIQINYHISNPIEPTKNKSESKGNFTKSILIDGAQITSSSLVGNLTSVLFNAEDLDIISGSPSIRRKYIDIFISQLNKKYLITLQNYQKTLIQRNNLLKIIRKGNASIKELYFWNKELIQNGTYLIEERNSTINLLNKLSMPIHKGLSNDQEDLNITYLPNISKIIYEENITQSFEEELIIREKDEILQGVTLVGPHRDDIRILINSMNSHAYASRGQSRTAILSMKLAQAKVLMDFYKKEPIILLDDVLSELDIHRSKKILDLATQYTQCIITTSDENLLNDKNISSNQKFKIQDGKMFSI